MPSAVYDHLRSDQYSRLIYGAIIGLALIVALEHEEPDAAVMAGTLVGTGVAVGLTELYSEFLGAELRTRRRVDRARFREIASNVVAVIFGASFPAIFFALAAAGAMETETAFDVAIVVGAPTHRLLRVLRRPPPWRGMAGGALPGGHGRAHWRVSHRVEGAPPLSPRRTPPHARESGPAVETQVMRRSGQVGGAQLARDAARLRVAPDDGRRARPPSA